MILPEKHGNNYLFTYKFIEFYGNNCSSELIKNNLDNIIDCFSNKCKNKEEAFIHFPVGNNKSLYIYKNFIFNNNPYLLLKNHTNDVKSYSIDVDNAKFLLNPEKLLNKMEDIILFNDNLIKNNIKEIEELRQLLQFIDKYSLISERY